MKPKKSLKDKFFKDSFFSLLATLTSRIGGLVFAMLLARFLLPEGFGIYSLAISVAILFVTFADLGISQVLVRYVAANIYRNKKKASVYFNYLFNIKILISSVSFLALLLSSYFIANYIFRNSLLVFPLIVLSFYVLVTALEGFFESLMYVKNKTEYIVLKEIIFQVIRIALILVIFSSLSNKYHIVGSMVAISAASFAALILMLFFFKRTYNFDYKVYSKIDKKRVWKFILFFTIAYASSTLLSYSDVLIMGLFLNPEYIGYYTASIGIIITIAALLSFSGVFLSALSKVSKKDMQQVFDKITKTLMVFAVPATVGSVILARYIIFLIYGYEYLLGDVLFYMLSPMVLLFIFGSLFNNVLVAREKTKSLAYLTILSTLLNIVLSVSLISYFMEHSQISAAKGVAAATTISWAIYFFGGAFLLKRQLGIKFKFSYSLRPILASAIMALVLLSFNYYVDDLSLFIGIIEVLLGMIVYFIALIFIGGLKINDLAYIKSILYKKSSSYNSKH